MSPKEPLTYGDRQVQKKNLQDMIRAKPRLAQLIAVCQVKDRQRAFAERIRKRK